MNHEYDVVILGGGLVGASLACALGDTTLRIAVIEAVAPGEPGQPSYDDRTIALAYSSRRIFEAIGVWQPIADRAVCPIEHIHISDRGRFGFARLHAEDVALPALGYVAETRALGAALYESMIKYRNIDLICPARVIAVHANEDGAHIEIEQGNAARTLHAALAVGADGADSPVRKAAGIKADRRVYDQVAVVANVSPEHDHGNWAYERFTNTGPLALLPMAGRRCAVVWSTRQDRLEELLALDDEQYLAALQARFGYRLGEFSRAGTRQAYPLALMRVDHPVRPSLVLIGNAAHTVHPVAGQGFNLGLRDVATLAQVLVEAHFKGHRIGTRSVLEEYATWRKRDTARVQSFTDGMLGIFSNDYLPLALGRNIGLAFVDLFPSIKRHFIKRTSGLNGRLPRLALGLPLIEEARSGLRP